MSNVHHAKINLANTIAELIDQAQISELYGLKYDIKIIRLGEDGKEEAVYGEKGCMAPNAHALLRSS